MKVGFIGTGMLGTAVGLHLLESGIEVVAQNRTREKTKPLEEKGAKIVNHPKEVASMCDLVITCVKDADAVKHVAFEENGIVEGKHDNLTVCDMSTINPLFSKEIAKKFSDNAIVMLDTPVMGGPNVAIKGELVMMASGDKEVFEKHKNIFVPFLFGFGGWFLRWRLVIRPVLSLVLNLEH